MKKSLLNLVILTFLTSSLLMGCSTPAEKVADAKENLKEANEDLEKAKTDEAYLLEIENYRKEVIARIEANDKSMAEFNAKNEADNKVINADHKKKIAELEAKNKELKAKITGYKVDVKSQWEVFKTEFSHDMEELGKALNDLSVKNVK